MNEVATAGSLITTHEGGSKDCGEGIDYTCEDGVSRVVMYDKETGTPQFVHYVGGYVQSHLYYDEAEDACVPHHPVLLAGSETVIVYPEKLDFAPARVGLAEGGYSEGCKATINPNPNSTVFAY